MDGAPGFGPVLEAERDPSASFNLCVTNVKEGQEQRLHLEAVVDETSERRFRMALIHDSDIEAMIPLSSAGQDTS